MSIQDPILSDPPSTSHGGSVTFAAGTSKCIVDSCTNTTVTDNATAGSNTVGTIG